MTDRLIAAVTIVVSVVSIGCATASGGARPANCDAEPGDSVFAAAGPVYHDCAVDRTAKLSNRPTIDFRPTTPANTCFSADVEFVVAANGKPETATARIVRTNNDTFADAVLRSLGQGRYDGHHQVLCL